MSYAEFLQAKAQEAPDYGFSPTWMPAALYPFQVSLVEWAVRKGRAALFCDCGLGTIERCIRLWSNPGDLVLSPFAGIGSEGYEAIRLNRRFIGFELKPAYAAVAARNLRTAEQKKTQGSLFAEALPDAVRTDRGGIALERE
jgi:hypothetical protein